MHIKKISVPAMAASKTTTSASTVTLSQIGGLIGAIGAFLGAAVAVGNFVVGPVMNKNDQWNT